MSVTAVNHFTILTDDLPATLAFYEVHLNLKAGARPPFKFPGAWLYADGGKGPDPILHIVAGIGKERLVKGVLDHMAYSGKGLAAAVAKLHSQTTGSPNAISQHAFEAGLKKHPPEMDVMRRAFAERRDFLLEGLAKLGLPCARPRGAFYVMVDVSPAGVDSFGFATALLHEHEVVTVPGSAFGPTGEGYVRLGLCVDPGVLAEGVERLASAVTSAAARSASSTS